MVLFYMNRRRFDDVTSTSILRTRAPILGRPCNLACMGQAYHVEEGNHPIALVEGVVTHRCA